MDKAIAGGLSGDLFAILIIITLTKKIRNSLPFYKFIQKLAKNDATKVALNCTASSQQLTALLMLLVSSGLLSNPVEP